MKPGEVEYLPPKIEVVKDVIAEKLDELSDIGEYWKKNREKGRKPNAIRAAMLMLINEIKLLVDQESHNNPIQPTAESGG